MVGFRLNRDNYNFPYTFIVTIEIQYFLILSIRLEIVVQASLGLNSTV